MNIFIPYPDSIEKSVQSLCDVRLNKQAVETYQLFSSALKERDGEKVRLAHPVYVFYKNNIDFLAYYGLLACEEYEFRTGKMHSCYMHFVEYLKERKLDLDVAPEFVPYYMEGSKNTPDCIRTTRTDAVGELFKAKLISKWEADKEKDRIVKFGIRGIPEFYKAYLEMTDEQQEEYWNKVKELKESVK